MRALVWIAAVVVMSGCGGSSDAPVDPEEGTGDAAAEESASDGVSVESALETMEMEGFEMRFYEPRTTTAGGQSPTFHVRAAGASAGAGEGWRMTGPSATIYGEDEQNVELTAATGVFDEASETATLAGGVIAKLSNMNLSVENINYDNAERVAYSDSPVHLDGEAATLDAESIRIEPKGGTVELFEVTGRIRLGDIQ